MKKNFKLTSVMLMLFFVFNTAKAQTTFYVSTGGDDAKDGSSWEKAFRNLTTALAAGRNSSSASVIINVASGTYKPSEGVPNSTDRDATFIFCRADHVFSSMDKSLKIYGGFDASSGIRTPKNNNTILSGDIGVEGDNTDNAYHVAVVLAIGSDADSVVVDGFTIQDGNANGDGFPEIISGVTTARDGGGGIFVGNNSNDKIAFRNCIFSSNVASVGTAGAGLQFDHSTILLENCVFENNTTPGGVGGAIRGNFDGQATIINSIFLNNSAVDGSAIYANGSPVTVTNSIFTGNSSTDQNFGCIAPISTTIFLANNVIYGNSNAFDTQHGTFNAANNIIQGGFTGTGNIDKDPKFKDAADGNGPDNIWGTADDGLRPTVCSPAVNAGSNDNDKVLSKIDITGGARIQNTTVDMGAYELSETPHSVTYYRDKDEDGWGDETNTTTGNECAAPTGYVQKSGDCDDNNGNINPNAVWVLDSDHDNYYTGDPVVQCTSPGIGYVSMAFQEQGDCNDNDPAINPGAVEICGNGIDDNCNRQVDENCSACSNATNLRTTNITAHSARLNWTLTSNPAKLQVQYKNVSAGSGWTRIALAGSATRVTISSLKAKNTYQWRIRAKCGRTWTNYSSAISFKTVSASQLNATSQEATSISTTGEILPAIKLYPNPTRGQFVIELHLANNIGTNAKIELVNMMGQTVSTDNANINNGTLYKNVSISPSLAPGMYIARIIVNNNTYTTKLMYEK